MAEDYSPSGAPAQKKSNTTLIIIIVVVVVLLLCCCVFLCISPIFGLNLLGPEIGNVFSDVLEGIMTPAP